MKWFNKCHALGVFMISFVLVVRGIRGDEENRVDAAKDPFEKVTLVSDGGAHSILFGKCLAASRTLEGVLYSIELPSAPGKLGQPEEFIRYVPDSSQLAVLPNWTTATSNPPVAKIVDCAAAAKRGGNAMFKYSGGSDCKVSNRSYDLKYTPACDAEERDAVFILNSVDEKCPLPSTALLAFEGSDLKMCVIVNTEPRSQRDAIAFCDNTYPALLFDGPAGLIGYNDVVKILKDLKVESNNFMTMASASGTDPWKWGSATVIDTSSMAVTPPVPGADDIPFMYVAYMKGSADFKLDFALKATFKGGVVCMVPIRP